LTFVVFGYDVDHKVGVIAMPFAVAREVIRHGHLFGRPLQNALLRITVFHEGAFPGTTEHNVLWIPEVFVRVARKETSFECHI